MSPNFLLFEVKARYKLFSLQKPILIICLEILEFLRVNECYDEKKKQKKNLGISPGGVIKYVHLVIQFFKIVKFKPKLINVTFPKRSVVMNHSKRW